MTNITFPSDINKYDEILVEHLAKIGFESQFDESWHNVRIFGIEGDMWRSTIREILTELDKRKLLKPGMVKS